MNLEKVHYLLTAIECGTFSLAAEKLGMTQSGLNRQISSLETELKTTLLLRGRRGVVPAKGAEPIIARLRDLMTAERRVHEEIAAVKGLLTGSLTIGSYFSISTTWLPQLLKQFSDAYPAITLSTVEGADAELIERAEKRLARLRLPFSALLRRRLFPADGNRVCGAPAARPSFDSSRLRYREANCRRTLHLSAASSQFGH